MGGFSALNLAMKHPDVFGITYALNPGLFSPDGLANHSMFADEKEIENFLDKTEEFASLNKEDIKISFMSFITNQILSNNYQTVFSYAYSAAFSPNPNKPAPYIDYPFFKTSKGIKVDSTLWKRYENGFGGLAPKIKRYKSNLSKLKAITIDLGINDYHTWIPKGCMYFSKLLNEAGISHNLLKYEGNHSDKLRERIEKYMLPFFSDNFR